MREAKKLDHCPARDPFGEPLQQQIEHAPVGLAREELVAIDKNQQRHRFAPKRMDDMAIIDDLAKFRSEEHTSELQSLMSILYADFCYTTINIPTSTSHHHTPHEQSPTAQH